MNGDVDMMNDNLAKVADLESEAATYKKIEQPIDYAEYDRFEGTALGITNGAPEFYESQMDVWERLLNIKLPDEPRSIGNIRMSWEGNDEPEASA